MAILSIIIPVYNEEATLADLLKQVEGASLSIDKEIIIIDDGSNDKSAEIMDKWASETDLAVTVRHQKNQGKGAAVREGIKASTGDIVIIQDADLEYDPEDYQSCIDPILSGDHDVVYGSREMFSNNRMHSSLAFYLGGLSVTMFFNILYFTRLTDEPTCYKTFRGSLIRTLLFEGNGFEWEPEITAKLLRLGFRIKEVPVSYYPRKVDEGKKIGVSDGLKALWEAWRWRFKTLKRERELLDEWKRGRSATDKSAS